MASFHPSPTRPKLELPAGACDTHFHVFGPTSRFPFAADRSYTPAGGAPKETLFALHRHLGIERGVVVQSAAHGMDNSAAADLIALGEGNYLGAAPDFTTCLTWAPPSRSRRCSTSRRRSPTSAGTCRKRSPVPVVIDHMARVDASLGLEQSPFRELLRLLEDRKFWVKLSGCERASRQSAPWRDAVPFARKLVAEFGERRRCAGRSSRRDRPRRVAAPGTARRQPAALLRFRMRRSS